MKRIKTILIFLMLLLMQGNALAKGVGSTTGAIMQQMMGARPDSLAEAYTSIEGDLYAIQYNPAALGSLNSSEALLSYKRGLAGDSFTTISYGHRTSIGLVIAETFSFYDGGTIDLMDISGNEWNVKAEKDMLIVLSCAGELLKDLLIGTNLKYFSSTIVEAKEASAFMTDVGILYRTPFEGVRLGVAVRNLGTRMKFIDEYENLPLNVRSGVSYQYEIFSEEEVLYIENFPEATSDQPAHRKILPEHAFLGSLDAGYLVYEEQYQYFLGMEYTYKNTVSIRSGYKFNSDAEGLKIGIGFKHLFPEYAHISIDYSFGLIENLDSTHLVSMKLIFM